MGLSELVVLVRMVKHLLIRQRVRKEVENILQRMREGAVQSANYTSDASDRKNLQAKMNALLS